jgi:DNA-binding response OmpR family regulator
MKGKILVVDDEEATRRSLADILRLEGFKVQAVASGEEAVEALRQDSFDVMLLDLKMPGMDGLDVMRISSTLAPDTRTILLTAHGSLESAIEALHHGAHDYLLKPSSPDQIVRSVTGAVALRAEMLRKRRLVEQLAASVLELRQSTEVSQPAGGLPEQIELGQGLIFDLPRRELRLGQQKTRLTPAESKLITTLLENRQKVFTHRELVQRVQGYAATEWEAPEVLRPLVSRLRRKLSRFPGGRKWLVSVRGVGYAFEESSGD